MKKSISKIVLSVMAFCLIVPCMFMLTACNSGHTHVLTKVDAKDATCTTAGNEKYYHCEECNKYFSDSKAQTQLTKNSWVIPAKGHTLVNGECACGYTSSSQPSTPTYTVTASQWNGLFELDNVTADGTIKNYVNSVLSLEYSQSIKNTETAHYANSSNSEEGYIVKQGTQWYYVYKNGNSWKGRLLTNTAEINQINLTYIFSEMLLNKYTSFTYESANHCYVAEDLSVGASTIYDQVNVYVENGKLIKVVIESSNGDNSTVRTVTFSNHGTTIVNVPNWTLAQ